MDAGRIRILYGITVLSGCLAVALEQVAETLPGLESLSQVAAYILLGVAGTMCLIIAGLLARAVWRGRKTAL